MLSAKGQRYNDATMKSIKLVGYEGKMLGNRNKSFSRGKGPTNTVYDFNIHYITLNTLK
jgi:hypothetical protein